MGSLRKVAEFYKALADESRLTILEMLSGQEMCACEIIVGLDLSQPTVAHHLKVLRQAELITDKKEGKWVYYTLNENVFQALFPEEEQSVIKNYAEPIKRKLFDLRPSPLHSKNATCLLKIDGEPEQNDL